MARNPGDDDIDDELRELTSQLDELTRLLRRALTEGGEPQEGDDTPSGDLWDTGSISPKVSTTGEYEEFRAEAATSTDMVVPYFEPDVFDSFEEKVDARYQLFANGYDSLQSLYTSLGEDSFSAVINKFAKDYIGERPTVVRPLATDLVDSLNPSYGFWGFSSVNDELSVTERLTPLDLVVAWGEFYHPKSRPWVVLGKREPDEIGSVQGGKTAGEVNKDLAEAVFGRRNLDLPPEYVELLSPDEQAEWRERNE
jgi:hypothetical protein